MAPVRLLLLVEVFAYGFATVRALPLEQMVLGLFL